MITGAAGMLGTDAVAAVAARGHDTIGLARADLDITDAAAVADAVAELRPDAIVNCAAWTDVDGAEANERGAMAVNDTAAGVVAATGREFGAKVLYVSSDYVFDGAKGTPYVESDMPAALSAYGRSKQAGETSTAIANDRHFIVRSSWLFGVHGPNFVETMLRIGSSQPEVVVVSDQVATPTYTPHLAAALARLIEGEGFGIHHVAAAGRCSWFDFAQEIFDQEGVECRVMAGSTEMLGRPAPRPPLSLLVSEREVPIRLPQWKRGLSEYLAARRTRAERVAP
jgi:dTDP-4-dehydrorhamnose reductase